MEMLLETITRVGIPNWNNIVYSQESFDNMINECRERMESGLIYLTTEGYSNDSHDYYYVKPEKIIGTVKEINNGYICVNVKEEYVDLLNLLLESGFKPGMRYISTTIKTISVKSGKHIKEPSEMKLICYDMMKDYRKHNIPPIYNGDNLYLNYSVTCNRIIDEFLNNIDKPTIRDFMLNNVYMGVFSFKFNSGLLEQVKCYENHVNSIAYIPRQNLRSTLLYALYVYTKVFKPEVKSELIVSDRDSVDKRLMMIVEHLPTEYQELYYISDKYEKTTTYLFIDEFEFIKKYNNYENYLNLFKDIRDGLIIANSTINDNLDPRISDSIDNNEYFKTIKVNPEEFGDDYMMYMRMCLDYDEDAYRREVLLERK